MPPPSPSEPPPRRRRWLFGLLAFAAVCTVLYVQRWPLLRCAVQEILAHRLDGDVHVGSLQPIDGGWRILDLHIRRPSIEPRLRSLALDRLDLIATVAELRRGRLAAVDVDGGVLVLQGAAVEAPPDPSALPEVGQLNVEDFEIRLPAMDGAPEVGTPEGRHPAPLIIEAHLVDLPSHSRGTLDVSSALVSMEALLALTGITPPPDIQGDLVDIAATLVIAEEGVHLQSRGGATGLTLPRTEDAEGPTLDIGPWQLSYRAEDPQDPWVGDGTLRTESLLLGRGSDSIAGRDLDLRAALLDDGSADVVTLHLTATEVDLRFIDPQKVAQRWQEDRVELTSRLRRRTRDGQPDAWTLRLDPRLSWFQTATAEVDVEPDLSLADLSIDVRGLRWRLPSAAASPKADEHVLAEIDATIERRGAGVQGRVGLHRLSGPALWQSLRLSPRHLPLAAHFDGTLDNPQTPRPALDGSLRLVSGNGLKVDADGRWFPLDQPPRVDVAVAVPSMTLAMAQSFASFPLLPDAWQGDATFALGGRLKGPLSTIAGRLQVTLANASLEAPDDLFPLLRRIDLDDGQATVQLSRPLAIPRLQLNGNLHPEEGPAVAFSASSRLALDGANQPRELFLDPLVLEIPDLGKASITGTWNPSPKNAAAPVVDASLDVEGIEVSNLLPYLPADLRRRLDGASPQGSLRGSWRVAARGSGTPLPQRWSVEGPVRGIDLGYGSADGSRVVEGLQLRFDSRVDVDTSKAEWSARLDGEVSGFLLLWDTFFGDFGPWNGTASIAVHGEVAAAAGASLSVAELSLAVELPQGPRLHTTARPSSQGAWTYEAQLDVEDLAAFHGRYLQPTFGELAGQEISGAARGRATGRATSLAQASIEGRVHLEEVSWESLANTAGAGLTLDLPFAWNVSDGRISGRRRQGSLRFADLTGGGFRLPSTATGLWTEGSSMGLEGSLQLPIFGGQVVLERLRISRLFEGTPRLESAVELRQLQLAALAKSVDLLPLAGDLSGRLERIEVVGQDLTVDGGGRFSLFGGYLDIGDISGSEIFSRFPRFVLSATARDIDLASLTRHLDFGEMHGTLQGSVEDCALFRGIPVTCRGRFETVDRPGVRRSVDVKAVNNLTILGTGASTNVFDRGIQRLFKRFTYSRFGVDVQLADDSLLLRGLEKRGGKELFMRGRLPLPIDIVNAQPGRRVSFQAMLGRLENLDFDAVEFTSGSSDR